MAIYELMGRGGGDSELALSLERVGWFRGVEGISLVGGEMGMYLGTGSLTGSGVVVGRIGKGVELGWIGLDHWRWEGARKRRSCMVV